jgi:hypothetical protein
MSVGVTAEFAIYEASMTAKSLFAKFCRQKPINESDVTAFARHLLSCLKREAGEAYYDTNRTNKPVNYDERARRRSIVFSDAMQALRRLAA